MNNIKIKRLREYIKSTILEILDDKQDEDECECIKLQSETSTSSATPGYMVPHAFKKKNKKDEYMEDALLESDEITYSTPQQEMAANITQIRNQLIEVEKMINKSLKFKNETDLQSSSFYRRTHSSIKKIGEHAIRILNKLQNIK